MKLQYFEETDTLYISLADRPSKESDEVVPGVVIDFDSEGRVVGIEIDDASKVADLTCFDTVDFL